MAAEGGGGWQVGRRPWRGGARRPGCPRLARAGLAAAEVRPDVGGQPPGGGDSNLRTQRAGRAAGWWRLEGRAPECLRGRKCAPQGKAGKERRVY